MLCHAGPHGLHDLAAVGPGHREDARLVGAFELRIDRSAVFFFNDMVSDIHSWLVVWNMNFIFPYMGNNNPI